MEKNIRAGVAPRRPARSSSGERRKGDRVRRRASTAVLQGNGRELLEENRRLYTLLEFSTLLSSTRGVDQLLKFLAVHTSSLLGAERTSIFIYDEVKRELWSKVAEGTGRKSIRVPVNKGIIGLVYRKGTLLNVSDAYRHPEFNRDVDVATGFHTRNILAAPMRSQQGAAIGVIEVLNKKSGGFTDQDGKMLMSIASLAAVALENSFLIESQINLFESFIESSIHALGERDRITYGHTIRVAFYADRIARAISDCGRPPFKSIHYTEETLKKLRFAALLHDIGKITVPESILNKKDKLTPQELETIESRFERFKLSEKIRALENGGPDLAAYRRFCAELDREYALVLRNRTPGPVTEEDRGEFDRMRRSTYRIGADEIPHLTEPEYQHLVISKGNLTPDEFTIMKDHVKKTWDILGKIRWPKDLREIPIWAATHHERPNGTGYPHGLKGDEIPLEGQILAVADIYDALTSADRPYKTRIPVDEAKKILRQAAEAGHVNKDIVELFFEQSLDLFTPQSAGIVAESVRGIGVARPNRKPAVARGAR